MFTPYMHTFKILEIIGYSLFELAFAPSARHEFSPGKVNRLFKDMPVNCLM